MNTPSYMKQLDSLRHHRQREHPNCVVCSPANRQGLQLSFTCREDHKVQANFLYGQAFEGYPGILHGGVVSSILDSAMVHALFADGIAAVTAELNVRFMQPVQIDVAATVRAWRLKSYLNLHTLEAQIQQLGEVRVRCSGKFIERQS